MIEIDSEALEREARIVWKEPPEAFPYLRESLAMHYHRRGPIAYHGAGRCIGYAELSGKGCGCLRRFWWFADHDPYPEFVAGNTRFHPAEAVEPSSIRAGAPSNPTGETSA